MARVPLLIYSRPLDGALVLGKPENLMPMARAKGVVGNQKRAALNENNVRAIAYAVRIYNQGLNYTQIADEFNQNGFRTALGCLSFAQQVKRLILRAQRTR